MVKILAAGDIHGDKQIADYLSKKAIKNNTDLIILAGDIFGALKDSNENLLESFKKNKQKVFFVGGNWDTKQETDFISKYFYANNLENKYFIYDDIGMTGIGNTDWKMNLSNIDFTKIKNTMSKIKTDKKLLVSHGHAEGTKAEFSGIKGDKILRKAIDELKPDFVISAHIHEAEGLEEKIGKTKIIQVGRKGKIINL
jgi:Icc-related predicted phosphoesterase